MRGILLVYIFTTLIFIRIRNIRNDLKQKKPFAGIPEEFYKSAEGLENEPEKGKRCSKCFELRLRKTAELCKKLGINLFTTSIVISPHKNFQKLSEIGRKIAEEYNLTYIDIDFKKKDGFLKTNKISKELGLYRQNYCGCKFSLR